MAATICRQGMKETAVFVCWKHSRALTLAVQRHVAHHHPPSSPSRPASSSSRAVGTRNIEGFELTSQGPPGNPHPRPVVVLIGWLNAKRRHLLKYQEMYMEKGFDVLTMHVSPIHIVRPKMGIKYTSRLLKALQDNKELASRKVVVHGFSIGAFIYTQLQIMLQQQQQRRRQQELLHPGFGQLLQNDLESPFDLSARIAGVVLDSPAYINHMCSGIANSVTVNPLGRSIISKALLMYLAAFPKSVTFHYHESERIFHNNSVPTLIMYSPVDLISSAMTTEMYVEEWKEKGYPAFTCKFPRSTHVSHFRDHPEEYMAALHAFIDQLDLQAPQILELEQDSDPVAPAAAEVQPLQAKAP